MTGIAQILFSQFLKVPHSSSKFFKVLVVYLEDLKVFLEISIYVYSGVFSSKGKVL